MQLKEGKAKARTAQLTRFLVLPKHNKPANETTRVDNIQQSVQRESRWRTAAIWLAGNPKVAFGLGIVGFFVLVAILGPIIIQHNPNAFSSDVLQPPSAAHWLGTTQTGQDVFAQVIDGTRVSVLLGLGAGFLATIISVIIGLTAGYFGGLVDDLLSLLINIFLVIPALPLAVVLAAYFPFRGPLPVAMIVTFTGWAWGARVLRSQTLSMRRREFVEAARASGETTPRIIFAEILPNEIAIIAAGLGGTLIYAILAQGGLAILGLGDVTIISWGAM